MLYFVREKCSSEIRRKEVRFKWKERSKRERDQRKEKGKEEEKMKYGVKGRKEREEGNKERG